MVQEKTAQNSSEEAQGSNEEFYPAIMNTRCDKVIKSFKLYLNKKDLYAEFPLVMSEELLNCDSSKHDLSSVVELYKFLKENSRTEKSIVELLAKNRKNVEPEEYTKQESKIFAGMLSLALIINTNPGLENTEPEYKDLQNNFNYFLPECNDINKSSEHFGSFSFYNKDKEIINKITYTNIPKTNVLKNKETIYDKIWKIIKGCLREIKNNKVETLLAKKLEEAIIFKENEKINEALEKKPANIDIFQNYFSKILHVKQNDLMLLIDPSVPLILSKGPCNKKPDAKLPCEEVDYYIELSGDLDELFESYLDNCINCINGKDGNSKENCNIEKETTNSTSTCKLDKKWYNLLNSLHKLVKDFVENHHGREDEWEVIKKSVTNKTSYFYQIIELIIPFIFFDKPFLICTQHSYRPDENDIKYPERIITCSVAVDPKSNNIENQRRWVATISSTFNGFTKSVINSFIELDQRYAEAEYIREKTRADERNRVVSSISHEIKNVVMPLNYMVDIISGNDNIISKLAEYDPTFSGNDIMEAQISIKYLQFLSSAFGGDSVYGDLLDGKTDIRECMQDIWKISIYIGCYLSKRARDYKWIKPFVNKVTTDKDKFFPDIPSNVCFHKDEKKRMAQTLLFIALFSNCFKHFIDYICEKEKTFNTSIKNSVLFFYKNLKIIIEKEKMVVMNMGFSYNDPLDKSVGTRQVLETSVSEIFWKKKGGVFPEPMFVPVSQNEGWHKVFIEFPEGFWATEEGIK